MPRSGRAYELAGSSNDDSSLGDPVDAQGSIQKQFNTHACKREDASQAGARIVFDHKLKIAARLDIAPRSLFDVSLGHDSLFHGDKYKWSAQFTVINLTNDYALYNFLSTFSGTDYVTPRTLTAQIGFHF